MIKLTKDKIKKVKLNRPLDDAYKGILKYFSHESRSKIQAGVVFSLITQVSNTIWIEAHHKIFS